MHRICLMCLCLPMLAAVERGGYTPSLPTIEVLEVYLVVDNGDRATGTATVPRSLEQRVRDAANHAIQEARDAGYLHSINARYLTETPAGESGGTIWSTVFH